MPAWSLIAFFFLLFFFRCFIADREPYARARTPALRGCLRVHLCVACHSPLTRHTSCVSRLASHGRPPFCRPRHLGCTCEAPKLHGPSRVQCPDSCFFLF